jgi:hypothetical protein
MAFAYSKLAEAVALQAAGSDIIDSASGTKYIKIIVIHNVNTAAEAVSLYLVPDSGGSKGSLSDTANRFYYETLPAGATRILEIAPPGLMLVDNHDSLQGKTTVNSKVLVWVYGGSE